MSSHSSFGAGRAAADMYCAKDTAGAGGGGGAAVDGGGPLASTGAEAPGILFGIAGFEPEPVGDFARDAGLPGADRLFWSFSLVSAFFFFM